MLKPLLHRLALPASLLTLVLAFALSGAVGHAETPANDGTITPLRTREGAIQHVATATSGKNARYSVEITAGEQVALKTTNSAFSGQYVIRWRKPGNAVLYQETWAPNENWFWPSKTFTKAGTYTLEVDPVGPATGSVDLHVWNTTSPAGLTLATSGEESSKTFSVEAPTEVVDIHLSGTAGERLLLQGSEADFVGSFHLLGPDGSTVPGSEAGGNLNETRQPFELPETGEYTIELYGDGMETGSVKLTASAQNEVLSGQITPSRSPEGAIQHVAVWTPGRNAQFSVDVSAGEYVSLKAVNSTFNGGYTIRWYDPSGTFLQSLSSGGFEDAYVVPRRFDEAGTYTLEVDPAGTATGSLDLKVWDATSPDDLTLATSGEESSKTFSVEVPGEVAKVRFRGIRGQEIHLDATESSFDGQLAVKTPQPGQVASGSLSTSSDLHLDFALPESGAYTVWLYANSDHTGSVRLTASTDESDEITGQISPTPTGTEQHVEFDSAEQFAHYTVPVEAGEWVSMVSEETELGSAYRVEWLKPSGELLQRFNQPGDRDMFFERVHFDETGDATLVVVPEDGAGSVDLTVYDASDRIAQIAAGEAQTFTLTAPRQQYLIEIDGTAGEQLEIIPSGADFVGFFHLQTPAGEFLPGSTGNTMTDYWSMNLPETGTYTLVLAGNGAQTGSVTLEPVEVREDEDLTGTITPLATPDGALQHVAIMYSHQNARYSVEITAGERVALKPTNSTFGGAYEIRWKNADGQTLYHARWNGDEEWFWPPKTFDEAGTYTLELDPDGSVRGSTDLRLWDSSSPDGLTLDTSGEGSSKVFDVNVPGQRLNIDLDGNAGERLSIRGSETELEGEFHVLAPDGSPVANAEGGLTERHGPFELPETGTYTVVLTPVGEQTGSLRLTVRDGGGFEVIPGTIEPTTAGAEQHVEFSGPDQVAHYTVPVTPGEWVSIVAGAAALDPGYRLEWLAPDGRSMQTWFPSAEGGFFEPVYFSESGDATLVVAPENGATGSVDLTLYDASDQTGQIVPGESATFGVAAPGQRSLIEIPGAEDHQLSIIPSGADFEGELHLRTPSGEVLEGVGGDLSGPLGPVYLSENGTYTIILTGTGAHTGTVTLEAVETDGETGELDGAITPLATAGGALQHVAISSFGRRARYSVEMTEGEKVALKTTESAFDGGYYIRWLDPSGNVVNSERWNGTENWFWAPQTFTAGTYTLVVDPEGTATGSVDLRLWEDPTLTGQELELSHAGDSATSTIDIPGQAEAITFAGEANRSVQITTSESTFEEAEATLIAPVGYAVQSSPVPGGIEAQLPEDGTYVIQVEGRGESTGSVLVELLDDSPEDITGQIEPTAAGVTQHVAFASPDQVARYTVPVAAGESVSMISSATALGPLYRVEWLNPAGEAIQAWYPSGESDRFFETVRFEEAGDATLVVAPEGVAGSVDLTLYDATEQSGQLALGEAADFSIAIPGQRYLIELEGAEGEEISLVPSDATFEGDFFVKTPAGEWLEGSGGGLAEPHGPVTLPETGIYTIVLTGNGAQTGSVTLDAGSLIWGTIVPSEPGYEQTISFPGRGDVARYSVPVTAGESVSLRSSAASLADSYRLEWLDPAGQTLKTWHSAGDAYRFFESVRFEKAGRATLVLTPEGEAAGSVTFTAYDASDRHGTIVPTAAGTSRTFSIGVPGRRVLIGFDGLEGEHLTLTPANAAFQGYFEVQTPDGTVLPGSGGDLTASHALMTLPAAGRYTIVLTAEEGGLGSVRLEAKSAAPLPSVRPKINGEKAETGEPLESDDGEWTGDMPMTFKFQWLRCAGKYDCVTIDGATAQTYIPDEPDIGKRLRVDVTATNVSGSTTESSSLSSYITQRPPHFVSPPTLPEEVSEGDTVEVDTSSLTGGPPMTLSYEWQRCWSDCQVIAGASGRAYAATAADAGKMLRVHVVATNATASDARWSNPSGIVQSTATSGPPQLSTPPMIGGLMRASETIGATEGSWAGEAPVSTHLQWQICDRKGSECKDISGETAQLLDLQYPWVGHLLRAKVTATNKAGQSVAYSAATELIHPAYNTTFFFSPRPTLEELETVFEEASMQPISLNMTNGSSNYAAMIPAGRRDVAKQISEFVDGDAGGSEVVSVQIADTWKAEDLGPLGESVSKRLVGPSLGRKSQPTGAGPQNHGGSTQFMSAREGPDGPFATQTETATSEASEEEPHQHYVNTAVSRAVVAGLENTTHIDEENYHGELAVHPGADRALYSYFDWEHTTAETLVDEYEHKTIAMEFDLKQENPSNLDDSIEIGGASFNVGCLSWQEDNFWIGSREPTFMASNAPLDAEIYWDTGIEDKCTEKDLTYGFYQPEYLEKERYETIVYFNGDESAGDEPRSPINWAIQILGRHCSGETFCVGISGFDNPTIGVPIIPNGPQSEEELGPEPSFPGCYRYWNPEYEKRFEEEHLQYQTPIMGASRCLATS